MKLPHLHILGWDARPQGHAHAIARINVGIGGGGINPSSAAGCKHGRLRFYVNRLASLNANGNNTGDRPILVFYQVYGEPFIKKDGLILNVVLIQRMQ